nr:hypothetical protein [Nitrospirota bacterium]
MGRNIQIVGRVAGRITAAAMLVIMLVAGIAAGPAMVKDLIHAGGTIPLAAPGSLPVIVDWSVILGHDRLHDSDRAQKSVGRARWAEGRAGVCARSCGLVVH